MARRGFRIVVRAGLSWLECVPLSCLPWLLHAFSTRRGGVSRGTASGLNLGFVGRDRRRNVEENRRRFLAGLGAQDFSLATLRQIHSTHIYQVTRGKAGKLAYLAAGSPRPHRSEGNPPVGDALLTQEAGILLSVRTADCVPILLVDPRRRAVAAVHAGWRGGSARIVEKTVAVMRATFGSDPRQILAAVGPGIQACCYEVGEEVVAAYSGRFTDGERFFCPVLPSKPPEAAVSRPPVVSFSQHPPGHSPSKRPAARLDLAAVVVAQLREAGLSARNIAVSGLCTACRTDLFFSHRQEGGGTGRMLAVIGIRP